MVGIRLMEQAEAGRRAGSIARGQARSSIVDGSKYKADNTQYSIELRAKRQRRQSGRGLRRWRRRTGKRAIVRACAHVLPWLCYAVRRSHGS
jgi:hypothetical protein